MPLAYYRRRATREFWSEHWGDQDPEALVRIARRAPLTSLIEAALPRGGRILEAGCGLGQYVCLFRERGYGAVGVDWSLDALQRCRKTNPGAPVAVADLGALGVKDGAVAVYLSLGVVEHDPEGPGRILSEGRRVLAPGGTLVLSVPYRNGVRRLLGAYIRHREARRRRQGAEFYQYAFTRREVREFLAAQGFDVLSLTPYDPARMLRKAPLAFILSPRGGEGRVRGKRGGEGGALKRMARRLLYTLPMLRLLGHMILAVAVKR